MLHWFQGLKKQIVCLLLSTGNTHCFYFFGPLKHYDIVFLLFVICNIEQSHGKFFSLVRSEQTLILGSIQKLLF